jgi:hypothetical protein
LGDRGFLKNKAVLAAAATASLGLGQQRGSGGTLENLTDAFTSLGRALKVISGLNVASNFGTLERVYNKVRV